MNGLIHSQHTQLNSHWVSTMCIINYFETFVSTCWVVNNFIYRMFMIQYSQTTVTCNIHFCYFRFATIVCSMCNVYINCVEVQNNLASASPGWDQTTPLQCFMTVVTTWAKSHVILTITSKEIFVVTPTIIHLGSFHSHLCLVGWGMSFKTFLLCSIASATGIFASKPTLKPVIPCPLLLLLKHEDICLDSQLF